LRFRQRPLGLLRRQIILNLLYSAERRCEWQIEMTIEDEDSMLYYRRRR
jgi:hypothetical protein